MASTKEMIENKPVIVASSALAHKHTRIETCVTALNQCGTRIEQRWIMQQLRLLYQFPMTDL